jgi:hypothetical protein
VLYIRSLENEHIPSEVWIHFAATIIGKILFFYDSLLLEAAELSYNDIEKDVTAALE